MGTGTERCDGSGGSTAKGRCSGIDEREMRARRHRRDDVGAHAAHPTSCGRCVTILMVRVRCVSLPKGTIWQAIGARPWIGLGLALVVILLGSMDKQLAMDTLQFRQPEAVTSWLDWMLTCHQGAAFSFLLRRRLAAVVFGGWRRPSACLSLCGYFWPAPSLTGG